MTATAIEAYESFRASFEALASTSPVDASWRMAFGPQITPKDRDGIPLRRLRKDETWRKRAEVHLEELRLAAEATRVRVPKVRKSGGKTTGKPPMYVPEQRPHLRQRRVRVNPGLFIQQELASSPEPLDCAELHRRYKENARLQGNHRVCTYHSFYSYPWAAKKLGLLSIAGEAEALDLRVDPALLVNISGDEVQHETRKVLYRLTALGRSSDLWQDLLHSLAGAT